MITAQKVLSVLWAGMLAFIILFLGQFLWGTMLFVNLKATPNIPWAVAVMAVVLWVMWQYLGGQWWPARTSDSRRRNLRARAVSTATFAWSLAAGIFAIVALAGLWIVLFQISSTPANRLADVSKYPLTTIIPVLIMSCLAAPFSEEAGFRGYAQSILERNFSVPAAIVISSALFAAAHLTYGFYWTKLTVYFLVGIVFAVVAHLANSILPAIAVHSLADLTFFTLVWPHDAARRLVAETGVDGWFAIHVVQIIGGSFLAVWCFRRLARTRKAGDAGRSGALDSLTVSA